TLRNDGSGLRREGVSPGSVPPDLFLPGQLEDDTQPGSDAGAAIRELRPICERASVSRICEARPGSAATAPRRESAQQGLRAGSRPGMVAHHALRLAGSAVW